MGEVLHYSHADWVFMKTLKGSIKFMQEKNNNGQFSLAIKQERDLLKEEIGRAA